LYFFRQYFVHVDDTVPQKVGILFLFFNVICNWLCNFYCLHRVNM
jgi:hypothetical protein